MEVARRCPLVVLLLCILLNDAVRAFVLDRRSKEANELTEALKVIQRAKRRLADDAVEPNQYWQEDARGPYRDEFMGEGNDNDLLEDLFAEGPREGVLNRDWLHMARGGEEPEEEVLEPGTEAVNKAELEDMFEEKNKEDQDKREYDPSEDMNKRDGEDTLSNAEVENLLDTAKDTEVRVLAEGGTSQEPVVNGKIKQVLQVAKPNGDGTNKVETKEDDWLITPDKTLHHSDEDEQDVPAEEITNVNKEWLMNLNEPMEINIKKKRSGDPVLAAAAAEERALEEEDEAADLTYIKDFIELEDDENNALANALNLATLSQVERTDKYIPLEVQYLKQSIKDEESIQTIKDSLGIGQDEGLVDEEDEEEDVLEPIVEEGPSFQDEVDEESEEEIRDVLSDKLRQFLMRTAMANNAIDDNFEDEKWYNEPVNPSYEGNIEQKAELNPFLRELLQQMYRKGAVSKRTELDTQLQLQGQYGPLDEDIDEQEQEDLASILNEVMPEEQQEGILQEEEPAECPAVEEYVDNCAYVRSLGMGLDQEALDLCNRHQLCYTCGSYYGLAPEVCDKGFLGEADRLCQGDEECKDEAAGLYFFMLKDHTYTGQDNNGFACAAECTYDYILGLDAKKK